MRQRHEQSYRTQGLFCEDSIEAEVIIYGATAAGIMAAVQLARMGRTVVIVTPDEHVGGLSASGLSFTDVGNKEVIGGLAREFYHRIYLHYQEPEAWPWQNPSAYGNKGQSGSASDPEHQTMWIFEPHVAEAIFEDFIDQYDLPVYRGEWLDRISGIEKYGSVLLSIQMLSGKIFRGKIFIDATYEGDLMAAAGIQYAVGREGGNVYDEQWNGIQMDVFQHEHHFKTLINPYVVESDPLSGVVPRISAYAPRVQHHGDRKIQAYCFRLCLTQQAENRVPITAPEGYDPQQYELLGRVFQSGWNEFFQKFDAIPNLKTDVNNHGPFSFDDIGMNYDYPEASYERRAEIIREHEFYQKGLLYFVMTDPRVPTDIQQQLKSWGYAKDEFVDNNHWPYRLYIREARRLIGDYVMTENDILGKRTVPNAIGMGSYTMDSHNVQRFITCDGSVQNEGDIGVEPPKPYQIALGTIMPKEVECSNLLVPVAVSASHIAFGSIRMEPVFMVLGQSAGTIAALALEQDQTLHDLAYADIRAQLLQDGQVVEYP